MVRTRNHAYRYTQQCYLPGNLVTCTTVHKLEVNRKTTHIILSERKMQTQTRPQSHRWVWGEYEFNDIFDRVIYKGICIYLFMRSSHIQNQTYFTRTRYALFTVPNRIIDLLMVSDTDHYCQPNTDTRNALIYLNSLRARDRARQNLSRLLYLFLTIYRYIKNWNLVDIPCIFNS